MQVIIKLKIEWLVMKPPLRMTLLRGMLDSYCVGFFYWDCQIDTIVPKVLVDRCMAVSVLLAPRTFTHPFAIAFRCSMWRSAAMLWPGRP